MIFREGGEYPFAENSAKIIYLIFEPFPKDVFKKLQLKILKFGRMANILVKTKIFEIFWFS